MWFKKDEIVKLSSLKHPVKVTHIGNYMALAESMHKSGKKNNITFIENKFSKRIAVLSGKRTLEWLNPRR